MCGFAGIFHYARTSDDITEPLLERMGEVLVHRGPDDSGTFVSPCKRVGLSFKRLSIIDLSSAGHQPMSTADGGLWIVFNGEIYNHRALRDELETAGYQYRSRTDTETILYAYQHWGEDFVCRLDGMFAIALWDAKNEKILLYRDRIGVKPLYYCLQNGALLFASEIKALLQHPLCSASVNNEALYHYFTYIHTPAPCTMFDGVMKLRAGHKAMLSVGGSFNVQRYWDPLGHRDPDFDYNNEGVVTEQIRSLFRSAVSKRMMSDVPFGVFLSGGIDSSANVAFMSEQMDRPVDTFTVAIQGQEDTNEFQWARKIAGLYHTNHHEIIIDDKGFLDLLPSIVYHQDEPLADPVCFPLYHVSKLARDHGTIVVQVGEGSDEQFAGYESYLRAVRLIRLGRLLRPITSIAGAALYAAITPLLKAKRVDYRQNVIRNMLTGKPVFWGNAIGFYEDEKRKALDVHAFPDDVANSYSLAAKSYEYAKQHGYNDDLQQIVYWEIQNRLAELLLMRVDKMTMAVSIEARVPFLDHHFVEFSMNIPTAMKLYNGTPKYILKQALRGILPDEIIERKKIGFAGSGKNMLTPEILKHARSLLSTAKHGYYNTAYIRNLLDEYERRNVNFTPQIWTLYNFELWYRRWIDGENSF